MPAISVRAGFASVEVASSGQASSGGVLETRSVVFSGKHFFVNMATKPGGKGSVSVAVLDGSGAPIAPYTHQNCAPVTKDSVRQGVTWNGAADLSSVAGKPVRLQFKLEGKAQLYSFWVSNSTCGESQGYVAAGGKGFDGMKDTKGQW